jgi:hypothetical protein
MKLLALVLLFFLLAFAGLAAGLILRRRGLRGACGTAQSTKNDCRCESELDSSMRTQSNCQNK